jgi:hypothetical protein
MRTRGKIVWGALAGLLLAVPTLAEAQNACLQHNRAKSWRAVDERTLIYTDKQDNEYTVRFRSTCRNLTRGDATLVNRHWSGLRCLGSGDSFHVGGRGTGASTCRVDSVQAGTPHTAAQ